MKPDLIASDPKSSTVPPKSGISRGSSQLKTFLGLTALLVACFGLPLYELARFALHGELFSHILLIPIISLYLVWLKKPSLPELSPPVRSRSLAFFAAGLTLLLGSWFASRSGFAVARHDHLTWATLSFLLCFVGICFFCLGPDTLRAIAFPLGFLIFIVPFPGFLVDWTETFLQHTSALGAHAMFSLTGMSFFRDGLIFQLPGIRIEVAPECSGIHSSLVLFITSIVAGHLFLRAPWKCWLLALSVIPLGIIRNAFRIWTIGELCVHVSPEMINSPIHRRGGPLFFAVSLVPFFLFLYYLRRSELKKEANPQNHEKGFTQTD